MRTPLSALLLALCLPSVAQAAIVLNELYPTPPGTDEGLEWVELHNNGTSSVDLIGWSIQAGTKPSSYATKYTFSSSLIIAPGGFVLVAESLVSGGTVTLPSGVLLAMPNASSSGDGVRLLDNTGAVVDTVVYGPNNDDVFLDDTGATATSLAPKPADGKSLARASDGVDTNLSASDFALDATPTPGAGSASSACGSPIWPLKINEIDLNPEGADAGNEWVELYNPTDAAVALDGWQLEFGSSSYSTKVAIPAGASIAALGYYVIGGTTVVGADLADAKISFGNASSSADGVRLVDDKACPVDSVVYGTTNTDNFVDDSGAIASSLAPVPPEGSTIIRAPGGLDSNASAVDFAVAPWSTRGTENPDISGDCGALTSSVVINEMLPDPDGSDDGKEWLELYNPSATPIDLSAWQLQTATKGATWGAKGALPVGTVLAGDEYLTIGGKNNAFADVIITSFDIPNGTHGDGVRLLDCLGVPRDTVVFGSDNDDAVVDDTGVARRGAPDPGQGIALARRENGVDTDECAIDFALADAASPGSANPEKVLDPCVSSADVVINEFLADPFGDDAGHEWIELYNRSGASISLSGWTITLATKVDEIGSADIVFGAGTNVGARGFFVVGGASESAVDLVRGFELGNGDGGDMIRLSDCDGKVVDSVVYGPSNTDGLPDDSGSTGQTVGDPPAANSLGRAADGVDDDIPEDWRISGTPTPGAVNVGDDDDTGGADDTDVVGSPGGCGKAPDDAPDGGGCSSAPASAAVGLLGGLLAIRRRRAGRG